MNVKPSHINFQDAFKKFDKEAEVINLTIFRWIKKSVHSNFYFPSGQHNNKPTQGSGFQQWDLNNNNI